MQVARNTLLWFIVAVAFISVLFADFLPLALGGYASQRFALLWLLAAMVSIAGAMLMNRNGWGALKCVWPALLLAAGFILLTSPFSDARYAWVEPGMYATYFLGFVFAGNMPGRNLQRHHWVVALVYVGAAAAALYGGATITVYLFALSDQVTNLSNFIPWGFVSIRYWSHIATWLIPLLPLAVLVGPLHKQRLWRFFVALGAALWWWVVFLSTSRGTMLGIAFGVLLVVIFIGRPALPWLKVFLRYLAYGLFAWLLLSVLIPSLLVDDISIHTLKTSTSGRMPLFIEAWRMSLENFPLGMGPQSWLTHDVLTDDYGQSRTLGHPHNMYLMWAAEYGWLLIGALFVLVAQAIRLFWQRRTEVREEKNSMLALPLVAFTASVSAALLHAGVSAVFMAPGSMLIGFLVLCVFWALITPDTLPCTPRYPRARLLMAILVAMLIGFSCYFWLKEVAVYHKAMESDQKFYYEQVPAGTLPRFWFHGNFPRHPDQMPLN